MPWTKIAKKDIMRESEPFWSPNFNESQLEDAIKWLEENWKKGYNLGLYMLTNEEWKYVLVKEGIKEPPKKLGFSDELVFEDMVDFKDKQMWLKNMKEFLLGE